MSYIILQMFRSNVNNKTVAWRRSQLETKIIF